MALSRRYSPEHPPGESCRFGMDFSAVIPPGVGIQFGTLGIATNTATPADASKDWTVLDAPQSWKNIGLVVETQVWEVNVRGRVLYATLRGGQSGTDYQITWTAHDTDGNVWPRTALCLCSLTS